MLRLSPGHAGDTFGGALAADGARIAVGAERGEQGGVNAGAAYVLQNAGGAWTLEHQLVAHDALPYDFLGGAVDLSGTRAIAGAR